MAEVPVEPKRIDFSVIPGTTGVVGNSVGVVLKITAASAIADWGVFKLKSALFSSEIVGVQSVVSNVNTVSFVITEAMLNGLEQGRFENYDTVWERQSSKEAVLRGKFQVLKGSGV